MKPLSPNRNYVVQFKVGSEGHLLDLLESLNRGAILVDAAGRVLRMNSAAEGLLGTGINVVGGHLALAGECAQAGLKQVIASATRAPQPGAKSPVSTAVFRGHTGRPFIVQAWPLGIDDEAHERRALLWSALPC